MVNAAYLTLELMIFYACSTLPATPKGTGVNFQDNVIKYGDGSTVTDLASKWVKMIPHTYCDQAVNLQSNGDVDLVWDHTKK